MVVTYQQDDEPWALGEAGARNLRTGTIVGSDPLIPYGDPDHLAAQLLRLAQFPHAGDLIVISTLYPDGQVAAFEELVGSHGGLGGQQTEAFLLHPADLVVPSTSNATDVFELLDARRGLQGEPLRPRPAGEEVDAWTSETLLAGLRDVTTWLSRAARTLSLDRSAFREVAEDPFATGPALLILLAILTGSSLSTALDPDIAGSGLAKFLGGFGGNLAGWILIVLLSLVAARELRGRGDVTRVMRTLAFAQIPRMIRWLGVVPAIGSLFSLARTIMLLLTMWTALQEALRLSRLRAALVPVVGFLVFGVVLVAITAVLGGTALSVETILSQLGLAPRP